MAENLLKTLSLFLIILISIQIQILFAGKSKKSYLDVPRFKEFACEFSDEMRQIMYPNATCKLTKIDRRLTAISVEVHFLNPAEHLLVRSIFYIKELMRPVHK
jgi:hypothetical protein